MTTASSNQLLYALLEMSRSARAQAFWRAFCTHLARVTDAQVLVVHSHVATLAFERSAARNGLIEVQGVDAARELCLPRLLQQLDDYDLRVGVGRVSERRLTRVAAGSHPLLQRHGCRDAVTMTISVDEFTALVNIAAYRRRQPRGQELLAVRRLRNLYPTLCQAIAEYNQRMAHRAFASAMQDVMAPLPVGLAVLDWLGRLMYANDEAHRLAHEWASRQPQRRRKRADLRQSFPRIPEIDAAVLELIGDWYHNPVPLRSQVVIEHPSKPGLRGVVSCHVRAEGGADPIAFVVRFSSPASALASEMFDLGRSEVGILARLSPTERRVAQMVMRGLKNQEVADELKREISTVKDHLTRIYAKLGVRNRTQLAGLGSATGRLAGRSQDAST